MSKTRGKAVKSLTAAILAGTMLAAGPLAAQESGVTSATVEDSLDLVVVDLESAIVNRGFVVDYKAHIGDMLQRTAADVGAAGPIYKGAEAMQFCSATLSRAAMQADAGNIAYCPYVLFAYERADEPGKVVVGFRRLPETGSEPSRAALAAINAMLESIVAEVAAR